ncbi:MAG TPA: PIN domain-containing protein [Vicinamibacterales bacterium]|nr:PIN domain-containing protein [Vicinamibacterales bacterium]
MDTSVWVAALRTDGGEAKNLRALLDDDEVLLAIPVKIELLSGTSQRQRAVLRSALSALPLAYPTDDTWRLMHLWTDRSARAGVAFGVGDLLIAALAHEAGALVWSLDAAFERLERLRLIDLYEP